MAEPRDGIAFDDAIHVRFEPATGGWRDAFPDVRRKITRVKSGSDAFWIGIASNGDAGVRARWNAKYKRLGMTDIAIVYTTGSDRFRREMERELFEQYEDHYDDQTTHLGGLSVGSGGFCVYVAWQR